MPACGDWCDPAAAVHDSHHETVSCALIHSRRPHRPCRWHRLALSATLAPAPLATPATLTLPAPLATLVSKRKPPHVHC